MCKYRFTAYDGEARIPYDFVLHDGKPVKLGDGTFGCVFHVRGRQQNAALKIFYENEDEYIRASQDEEIGIGQKLRKFYIDTPAIAASISSCLVAPIAYLTDFKESAAYRSLEGYFRSLSFEISNRAIVMDYFPMSLKDLLERGWPARDVPGDSSSEDKGPIGRGAGGRFGDQSGYSILEKLSQSDREASVLPVVQDVAVGLSILHGPRFRHQDIKPANVLVREVGKHLQAAIADLGFIDTGMLEVHGSIWQHRPLGTRHYRSPEQTDFFDVCEVDVAPGKDGYYELTTRDPKFRQTFSEKGDFVVFSKLPKAYQWEIADIVIPDLDDAAKIEEEPIRITIRGLDGVELEADERTQIAVNKRQTERTDLFGLGAIIYDMITCGRSPEQFYNLLRTHDRRGEVIETGLAQRYLHFKNGGGTVPEIDAVFQSLRVDAGSEFPSLDIVTILLKCMMSQAEDSYFRSEKRDGIWENVKGDLDSLMKAIPDRRRVEGNFLTNPKMTRVGPSVTPRVPAEQLEAIQKIVLYRVKNGCRSVGQRGPVLQASGDDDSKGA